jgi:hypothetical protein
MYEEIAIGVRIQQVIFKDDPDKVRINMYSRIKNIAERQKKLAKIVLVRNINDVGRFLNQIG